MSAYDPTQTLASLFALVLNQKTEVTENTHGVSIPIPRQRLNAEIVTPL